MYITGVDERDSRWERLQSVFRVYFFEDGEEPGTPWSAGTYDVSDADALEVLAWAQEHAGMDRLYAVSLIDDDTSRPVGQRRGLTWRVGIDANAITGNDCDAERRSFAAMLARRGKRIIDLD